MELKITKEILKRLGDSELDFEHLLYLHSKIHGLKLYQVFNFDSAIPKFLMENKYFSKYSVLKKGYDAYSFIVDESQTDSSQFKEFWELFPNNDGHGVFPITRILKDSKSKAEFEYNKCLKEGFKNEDIIFGLKKDLELHLKQSLTNNKLSFFKNSTNWLKSRRFQYFNKTDDKPQKITKKVNVL